MKHKTKKPTAQVWRAIKPRLPALLFWSAVLWITAELYAAASAHALLERGYEAIGGEAFIWLLPAAVYAFKRWAAQAIQKAEPVDADYIVLPPATAEELTEATVKLSGVMAAVGVSAEEAAESFKAFSEAAREAQGPDEILCVMMNPGLTPRQKRKIIKRLERELDSMGVGRR